MILRSGAEAFSASQSVLTSGVVWKSIVMGRGLSLSLALDQVQVHPPVLAAFVLDLADPDGADLAGPRDVGAATGLQVDTGDVEQADPAAARRRLDRHGAHQIGVRQPAPRR